MSFVLLFFIFPLLVSAQISSLPSVANFYYELTPGQATDDALVITHESTGPETVVVYASDAVGTNSPLESLSGNFFSYGERGKRTSLAESRRATLASWIRFLDPKVPEGSEEVREALTGTASSRTFELCSALHYGEMEKREREQRAVRALKRNLPPEEIQYLESLAFWCRGSEEAEIVLESGETTRVPFVLVVPNAVVPREYHAGLFVEFSDGTRRLAANVQQTTPGAREGRLSLASSQVNETESGLFRIELMFANTGERTVGGDVGVTVEKSFPKQSKTRLHHKVILAPGGAGTAGFVSDKPFFGSLTIRAYTGDEDQESIIFATFVIPWAHAIVLAVLLLIFLFLKVQKMYWRRAWQNALRESWSPIECEEKITISRFADLYNVPESLLALLNNVRTGYEFQPGDRVLLPPQSLILPLKKGGRRKNAKEQ